jgi:hypothetical protein
MVIRVTGREQHFPLIAENASGFAIPAQTVGVIVKGVKIGCFRKVDSRLVGKPKRAHKDVSSLCMGEQVSVVNLVAKLIADCFDVFKIHHWWFWMFFREAKGSLYNILRTDVNNFSM